MNARRNGGPGNVRQEGVEPPQPRFQEGDVVALTQVALRMGKLAAMTPRALYNLGHPNQFLVLHTFDDPNDGPCISLWPCCATYVDRTQNNKWRCTGHPVGYFEKVNIARVPKKGDKTSSLILPLVGEILRFDYKEDENNPEFFARVFGVNASVNGAWAKLAKKIAESNNII